MPEKKKDVKNLLKQSMLELETATAAKPGREYDVTTQEQLKELVEIALRQNKRIAERIDYLTEVLKEAVAPEEEPNKLLLALGKSQVEALEELEEMKKKLEENEKLLKKERAAIAMERARTLIDYEKNLKAIRAEQAKQLAELEKKISVVREQLSRMPQGEQIAELLKRIEEINEDVDLLSEMVTQEPEQVNARIASLKQELDKFKQEVQNQEKKTREEITKRMLDYLQKHAEETDKKIRELQEEEITTLVSEQKKSINNLQKKIESIENAIREYEEVSSKEPEETAVLIASLKQEIDHLKQATQENEKKSSKQMMEEFNKRITGLAEQISLLRQKNKETLEQQAVLKTLEAKVREIEQEVREYEDIMYSEPEKVEYLISKLKQDIDRMSKKLEHVDADAEKINELEARVGILSSQLQGIERVVVDKVTENVLKMKTEDSKKIEDILSELSEIRSMISSAPKESFSQASDSDILRQKVNALEKRVTEITHPPSKQVISSELQKVRSNISSDPGEQKLFSILSKMKSGEEVTLTELSEKTGLSQKELLNIISTNPGFTVLETNDVLGALTGKMLKKL